MRTVTGVTCPCQASGLRRERSPAPARASPLPRCLSRSFCWVALVFLSGPLFGILLVIAIIYAPFAVWAGHRSVLASLSVAAWGLAVYRASGLSGGYKRPGSARCSCSRSPSAAAAHAGSLGRWFVPCRTVAWTLGLALPVGRAPRHVAASHARDRCRRRLDDRAAWCWAGGWPSPGRKSASSAGSRPAAVRWPHPTAGPPRPRHPVTAAAAGHADRPEPARRPAPPGRREPAREQRARRAAASQRWPDRGRGSTVRGQYAAAPGPAEARTRTAAGAARRSRSTRPWPSWTT